MFLGFYLASDSAGPRTGRASTPSDKLPADSIFIAALSK